MRLDAGGFDRHTFLCGQSGSGKSYSLGLVLEQLLLETDLRIVILDPNSDCARLGELRDGRAAGRWRSAGPRWRPASGCARRIARRGAAAAALRRARARRPRPRCSSSTRSPTARSTRSSGRSSARRGRRAWRRSRTPTAPRRGGSGSGVANLGLERLASGRARTPARCGRPRRPRDPLPRRRHGLAARPRGAGAGRGERARGVWERRPSGARSLLVIDEAHNVCPAAPADALTAIATEHAVRIAAEGRKFGIYMLVATQRPQKVHENVHLPVRQPRPDALNSAADARVRRRDVLVRARRRCSAWPRTSASARRSSAGRSPRIRR